MCTKRAVTGVAALLLSAGNVCGDLLAVVADRFVRAGEVGVVDARLVRGVGVDVELVEAQIVERLAVVVGHGAVEGSRVRQEVGEGVDPAYGLGVVGGVGLGDPLVDPVAFEVDLWQ
jgi:hypothetical protein